MGAKGFDAEGAIRRPVWGMLKKYSNFWTGIQYSLQKFASTTAFGCIGHTPYIYT
jgi:hypothetical protein